MQGSMKLKLYWAQMKYISLLTAPMVGVWNLQYIIWYFFLLKFIYAQFFKYIQKGFINKLYINRCKIALNDSLLSSRGINSSVFKEKLNFK